MLLLKIQQDYAKNEDTDNVEELFDIMKEAEYGEWEEVLYLDDVL